ENCAVDRAIQTRLASRQEIDLSRLEGITRQAQGSAWHGVEGIEEACRDAVLADERYPVHLARGRRHDRASSLIRSRTGHQRRARTEIRSCVYSSPVPDACGGIRQNASHYSGGVCRDCAAN